MVELWPHHPKVENSSPGTTWEMKKNKEKNFCKMLYSIDPRRTFEKKSFWMIKNGEKENCFMPEVHSKLIKGWSKVIFVAKIEIWVFPSKGILNMGSFFRDFPHAGTPLIPILVYTRSLIKLVPRLRIGSSCQQKLMKLDKMLMKSCTIFDEKLSQIWSRGAQKVIKSYQMLIKNW